MTGGAAVLDHDAPAPQLLHRPSRWGLPGPVLLRRPPVSAGDRPVLLRRPDVVTLATVFVLLQFLIPARLVIGGLGAAGRPSLVIALGIGILWVCGFFQRGALLSGRQPVRWIVGSYVIAQTVSYAAGVDRGLVGVEARSADRWMIVTFAVSGLAVGVADGVTSRIRLEVLLGRLVGLTAVMAAVGALQAVVGVDLTRYIVIPGLSLNSDLIGVGARGAEDFARVAGTANHYIEFGVVLAMALPIALHRALHARDPVARQWRWSAAALIAVGIPFSISRSGMVGLAVSLAVLAVVWPWRFRVVALAASVVGFVVFRVLQPGVLGTIRSLFTSADNDPSVQNRIADYAYVEDVFPERPWFGRGVGTLLPDRYILLDNQYLNTALSGGVLGLLAFLGVFVGAYFLARSVRLRGADAETRHLGQALAASVACAAVCAATFDALSFATYSGLLFLLVGIVGALWRLDGGPASRRPLQTAKPDDAYVASPWMHRRPALASLYWRTDRAADATPTRRP